MESSEVLLSPTFHMFSEKFTASIFSAKRQPIGVGRSMQKSSVSLDSVNGLINLHILQFRPTSGGVCPWQDSNPRIYCI
jgi:hypothetical protein